LKKILTDAVAIGNATARAITFRPRDEAFFYYPGKSGWFTPTPGGSAIQVMLAGNRGFATY
jgi:hypothetical protein